MRISSAHSNWKACSTGSSNTCRAAKRSMTAQRAGQSLVRPELALLLSYAKISLNAQLIQSDVPEDPYLGQELHRYFPERLVKRYGNLLGEHRLKREIIVTATTNSIVNRMGPTFVARTQQDTGANAAAVARAYSIARESFDARETWRCDRSARQQGGCRRAVRHGERHRRLAAADDVLADPTPPHGTQHRAASGATAPGNTRPRADAAAVVAGHGPRRLRGPRDRARKGRRARRAHAPRRRVFTPCTAHPTSSNWRRHAS